MRCPRCGLEQDDVAGECARCGVVFAKVAAGRPAAVALRARPAVRTAPVLALEPDASRALLLGGGAAVVALAVPFVRFVLSYLAILVHELGHAVVGWLFGYPAVPAFDFVYGGGVTLHEDRKIAIVILVLAGLGLWGWTVRKRRRALAAVAAIAALYAVLAFTSAHEALDLFMGHGAELVFAGIFLYRAMSGAALRSAAERPVYAFAGWFLALGAARFAVRLIASAEFREAYADAKGGGDWMDFSRIAHEYLHTGIPAVAASFLACCVATPVLAWLAHRHHDALLGRLAAIFAGDRA